MTETIVAQDAGRKLNGLEKAEAYRKKLCRIPEVVTSFVTFRYVPLPLSLL